MVKQNTWENTLQSRVWTALTAGNRGQAMVWPGAAAVSRSQADPVLKLFLSLGHHPEHCSGKTSAAAGTEQHHLSGLGLTSAHLLEAQNLEGVCGGWQQHTSDLSAGTGRVDSPHTEHWAHPQHHWRNRATTSRSEMEMRIYMLVFRQHELAKEKNKSKWKKDRRCHENYTKYNEKRVLYLWTTW